MSDILFLILRRLRAPLITVIIVYAISVGGLALIPGLAPDGSLRIALVVPVDVVVQIHGLSHSASKHQDVLPFGIERRHESITA